MLTFFDRRQKPVLKVDFVEPQLNLLAHAQSAELDIGSQCGGHGICGKDRIRIDDLETRKKLSAVTHAEREHLSDKEIAEGCRLACQVYPNSKDLDLRVCFGFSGKGLSKESGGD